MGKDGSMYLLTKNHEGMDKLGNRVHEETRLNKEGPRKVDLMGFKLVNSVLVHKVLIDDPSKVLYKRNNEEIEFFYLRT